MNKQILLGLLLVPCLGNAMCEPPINKHEDTYLTRYIRGTRVAKREYTLAGVIYSSGTVIGNSIENSVIVYTTTGDKALEVFQELEDIYERQK